MRSKSVGPALAVLFLVNVLNFYDRQTLAAILEPLRHEFSLSDTQLGGLFTLFTVVFALAGLPLGKTGRYAQPARTAGAGIAVWTGLTGLAGLATQLRHAAGDPAGRGDWRSRMHAGGDQLDRRPGSGLAAGARDGGLHDGGPGGHHAELGDRRSGGAGARLADGDGAGGDPGSGAGAGGAVAARTRTSGPADAGADAAALPAVFWWIAASGAVVNFALYSFSTFLPAFLTRYHGMSVAQAGIWTGIGSGVSGILGAAAAGAVGRSGEESPVAGGGRLAGGGGSGVRRDSHAGGQRGESAVWLAMTGYGLLQMYYGLVYAAIQDVVGPAVRGRAMAVYFVVTYLGGASWGPLLTGRLSDFLARRSRAGGGGVARGGTARRDVRDSGAGGGAGGGAVDGGTAGGCGVTGRRRWGAGGRGRICGDEVVMAEF